MSAASGFAPPEGARPRSVTPDDAIPGLRPASWGRRAGALLIDYGAIPLLLAAVAATITYAVVGDADAYLDFFYEDGELQMEDYEWWLVAGGIAAGAWFLVGGWLVLGLTRGRSPGRRLTGIRVVGADGAGVGVGTAFLREGVVKSALSFLWLLPLILSYLWPLWDAHNRALHDIVCSTRVVDDTVTADDATSAPVSGAPTPGARPRTTPPATPPPAPDGWTAPVAPSPAGPRDDDALAKRIGLDG